MLKNELLIIIGLKAGYDYTQLDEISSSKRKYN